MPNDEWRDEMGASDPSHNERYERIATAVAEEVERRRVKKDEAAEILKWMEKAIDIGHSDKKSWVVRGGQPDIICLLPGKQAVGPVTYATMIEALRAAMAEGDRE